MNNEKANREMLARFVREHFRIRSGEIPSDILRRLRVKGDPDLDDLTKPCFQPIHDLMADMIALYEKRLNVKIRIIGMDEYVRLVCRAGYDCRLCGFMEYLFNAENRTVYIEKYEYDVRVLISCIMPMRFYVRAAGSADVLEISGCSVSMPIRPCRSLRSTGYTGSETRSSDRATAARCIFPKLWKKHGIGLTRI